MLLSAALILFYWPWLAGQSSFYILDFFGYWQPIMTYLGEHARAGSLPHWNPWVVNGMPQLFYPSMLYPLNWLFAIFDFNRAMAILLILQQIIAGVGIYLLIASLGWGVAAASFAGAAIALCGLMFSLQPTFLMQGAVAWFPLSLWLVRRIGTGSASSKLTAVAACAVTTSWMIAAGMTEVFAPAIFIMASYAIIDFAWREKRKRRDALVLGLRLLPLALAVGLSAPVLLPMSEWAALSERAQGLPVGEVLSYSASWYDLLCLFISQPFGDAYTSTKFFPLLAAFAMPSGSRAYAPFISSAYLGPIAMTLALCGLGASWRGRWLVAGATLLAAYVALGFHSPYMVQLVEILQGLHWAAFRFPIKAMVWVTLGLVVLAARGCATLEDGERSRTFGISFILWISSLASGLILIVQMARFAASKMVVSDYLMFWSQALAATGQSLFQASILGVVASLIYWFGVKAKQPGRQLAIWLMLASLAGTLLVNAWQFNRHPGPADFYEGTPYLAQVVHQQASEDDKQSLLRIADVFRTPIPTKTLDFSAPYATYQYKRQLLYPMSNIPFGIAATFYRPNAQTADDGKLWTNAIEQNEIGNDVPLARLCQLTGTRFVCTLIQEENPRTRRPAPMPALDTRFFTMVHEDPAWNVRLFRVTQPLPRAYFAPNPKWARPHEAILDTVQRARKTNFDPHAITLLEHQSEGEVGPSIEITADQLTRATARITTDEPEKVGVEADAESADFLMLTDLFYPGWTATIDGAPSKIYQANLLCRAVYVPAGHHRIEFVYKPTSVRVGRILAMLAAALIVLLCLTAALMSRSARRA